MVQCKAVFIKLLTTVNNSLTVVNSGRSMDKGAFHSRNIIRQLSRTSYTYLQIAATTSTTCMQKGQKVTLMHERVRGWWDARARPVQRYDIVCIITGRADNGLETTCGPEPISCISKYLVCETTGKSGSKQGRRSRGGWGG